MNAKLVWFNTFEAGLGKKPPSSMERSHEPKKMHDPRALNQETPSLRSKAVHTKATFMSIGSRHIGFFFSRHGAASFAPCFRLSSASSADQHCNWQRRHAGETSCCADWLVGQSPETCSQVCRSFMASPGMRHADFHSADSRLIF